MSTPHPAAAPYAVLRVDRRKAKAMAAIAASSAHTMREKPTPNADPDGVAPLVLYLADGKTPYQAARHLLDGAERRNRDTVLCREIVLSASPSYFRPGRESMGGVFEPSKVKAWAAASLGWAKRQWPDQLASFVIHADEQNIHAHLLVVPRVKSAAGVWKLNSKALFDRERLRELQTGYGKALAPLGIRRGEPGSQAKHSEVRQFYGAVNAAKSLPERVKLPPAPKPPLPPRGIAEGAVNVLGTLFGIETLHQRTLKAHAAEMTQWRETCRELRQRDAAEWQRLKAQSKLAPLMGRQQKVATPQSSSPIKSEPVARRPSSGPR
ncbi:plasmid recombination protein [Limnohabitans sp. T6-5]|uniref:plasmid recombination protein n=1 Tax=Limnohabitans sp. T6-5 TaxID=1100724 RepID=UPI001304AC3F|nr:plasmid recombination protein [Limnohabitans sp. T6-5]